jgi:hypothetical protein
VNNATIGDTNIRSPRLSACAIYDLYIFDDQIQHRIAPQKTGFP